MGSPNKWAQRLAGIAARRKEIEAAEAAVLSYFHQLLRRFPPENFDRARALAYILQDHRRQNAQNWQKNFDAELRDIIRPPASLAPTRLGLATSRLILRDLKEELQEAERTGSEDAVRLRRSVALTERSCHDFEGYLANGKVISPDGVPDRYLPDWFFVADLRISTGYR